MILILIRKELLDILRDRRTIIINILAPLLLFPVIIFAIGAVGAAAQKEARERTLEVNRPGRGEDVTATNQPLCHVHQIIEQLPVVRGSTFENPHPCLHEFLERHRKIPGVQFVSKLKHQLTGAVREIPHIMVGLLLSRNPTMIEDHGIGAV